MTRYLACRSACLAAFLAVASMATTVRADDGRPAGDVIAATSLKDLKDQPTSLDKFKGKVTLLYFWATWCVPCRAELPRLIELNDDLKAKGLQVVGVAVDKGDKVRAFVEEKQITYPIFYGNQDAVALGKALGNDTGGIPYTVIIGKDGKLVHSFSGDLPRDEVRKIIDPLLG